MPDLVPDGLDEMDLYADEFERLGRAAGAELRGTPASASERAVVRSAGRRRTARAAGSVVAVLALVVVGMALIVRSDDEPQPPSDTLPRRTDPGWIVYEVGGGPRELLFLVRPDGSDAHPLVAGLEGGDQSKPDWSPDGDQIVFTMPTEGGESLWTVSASGADPELLLDCTADCITLDDPAWSPDGTKVVFARLSRRGGDAAGSLEQVDVATRKVDVLLDADPLDFFAAPRWSPDGRSLVLEVVHRDGSTLDSEVTGVTLSVAELDHSPPEVSALTTPDTFAVTPDWSPNGDLIVFAAPASPEAPTNDLFTVSPNGGQPVRLTFLADDGGDAAFPAFDHTGELIVFSAAAASGPLVLSSVGVDGSNLTALGTSTISAIHPRP